MSEPETPDDLDAPIVLDGIDPALGDVEEPGGTPSARRAPPPLPAVVAPLAESAPAKRSAGKTAAYVVLVVAMLAAAAWGGLGFGELVRGKPPAASAAAPPSEKPVAAAATAAPAPTAVPTAATMSLPEVQIR